MVRRRFSAPPPLIGQPAAVDHVFMTERDPTTWIGFVGDISPLGRRDAAFDPDILEFFRDCSLMVGNLEGVITSQRRWPYRHNHTPRVFECLENIKPLSSWLLSVANNHAADYGDGELNKTVETLENGGVRWFGTSHRPTIGVEGSLTLTAWTQWLNRPTKLVCRRDPGVPTTTGLHIAYPHWGFEHERRPRPSQVTPLGYPLVVGHHSHLPQPLERRVDGVIVAWSLGNFLSRKRLPVLGEGALLKVGFSTSEPGVPEIVSAHFRRIRLENGDSRYCRVVPAR